MRDFRADWREWITGETRDLLIIIEHLKEMGLAEVVDSTENKIMEIQATCNKDIFLPMKKYSEGRSRAKDEAEHFHKFRLAMENAERVILELRNMRTVLEGVIHVQLRHPYAEPERTRYIE